jgi:hypothetical protein
MGESRVTPATMTEFVKKVNPAFNPKIAEVFIKIGDIYGIRGDVAFIQSVIETNWFRFGGDVRAEQNNFAGLGAVGDGARGASFSSIEEGVRAQIQHLYAYASKNALPKGEKLVDPRFQLVTRGSANNWEDLAGKWAVPGYDRNKYASFDAAYKQGATYGQLIINSYTIMAASEVTQSQKVTSSVTDGFPSNTAKYKIDAVAWLYEKGYLTGDSWKKQVDEPLPLWALALVLQRLHEDLKNG